jgi:hypothetical protein
MGLKQCHSMIREIIQFTLPDRQFLAVGLRLSIPTKTICMQEWDQSSLLLPYIIFNFSITLHKLETLWE